MNRSGDYEYFLVDLHPVTLPESFQQAANTEQEPAAENLHRLRVFLVDPHPATNAHPVTIWNATRDAASFACPCVINNQVRLISDTCSGSQ